MDKLTKTERVIVEVASLSLIATFFVPIWRIDLFAPQYPEGLTMKIWLNDIEDVVVPFDNRRLLHGFGQACHLT